MNAINSKLSIPFMVSEDHEILFFWSISDAVVTKRMWAAFNKLLFDNSNVVIMIVNSAHIPICFLDRCLANIIKFKNPKIVMENLCKMLRIDDLREWDIGNFNMNYLIFC